MFLALMITIVALGDSTTAGTPAYRSPLEAPPNGSGNIESQYAYWLMQSHPDWQVLNRGVNGERSDQIRERFARDAAQPRPAVVVIIAGVNDVYQGRTVEHVLAQLRTMYDRAAHAGIRVVGGTIVPYNTAGPAENERMRQINAWIREQTRNEPAIAFVDTRAAVAAPGNIDHLAESPDGLHPSPGGYRAMADTIRPVLQGALRGIL